MSDNGSNVGLFVSIGSVIASLIGFITFWTRLSDRITLADQKAERAIQEAAEAKNDVANARETFEDLFRELGDKIERRSREDGEGLAAIRTKITEVELFMRDHFVRAPEFNATMSEIKAELIRIREKLEQK